MAVEVLEKKINEKVESLAWKVGFEKKVGMSVEEQLKLRDENWDSMLEFGKALDDILECCETLVSGDDEIAEIVAKDRREQYEASLRG